MEGGGAAAVSTENQTDSAAAAAATSYTYWVRGKTEDAAPLPVPRKLTSEDLCNQAPSHLGSAWNRAGTWEEKNLNKWASDRIKELLPTIQSLEFSGGKAEISEVTRCTGDAFLVTVRNKKRVGYTYELTLRAKGEWLIGSEKKIIKGSIDIEEFSFGELDELKIQVRLTEEKDLPLQDKQRIINDLKQFLRPLREKLSQFEQELKDR
ncbi:OLC1v1035717C1 [Oldenlandia corymbosa var. corymbosa]|uniref:OLC1v1035717C1 n=1 Tax=Oldenlandia corymbosa var. corymbosa TaxID=529605 RepID=A0AAV1CUH0_OLDCO|nr:OLC1v1035717C1 [Oldenlandia corymbosa var. corymbosa]